MLNTALIACGLLLFGVTAGQAVAAEQYTYADLVGRLNDLERLATPVKPGEKTFASTSHNRAMAYDPKTDAYQHWGANDDAGGCIRSEGDQLVMVDLKGPGVLWRTWSAEPLDGHIRIYLDGNDTPIIDKPFNDYFGDFEKKYPGLAMTLSRGRNEFIPISFARSCKVVVDKGWGRFFHCTHTVFSEDTEVESFPGFTPEVDALLKEASEDWLKRGPNPHANDPEARRTTRTLAIGSRKSQDVSLPGAGAIRVLKVTPLEMPEDRIEREDVLREMTLSIHWDGEEAPSVWSPLGDFFATSPGINPYKTLPMGCIDGTFYSYWYMPYADGARLVVTNDGKAARKVAVELETVSLDRAEASKLLRFCAAWHSGDFTGLDSERFMKSGGDRWPDWPLLVVEGKGRYVGMTEHIWKFGGWWGEGDEKFFVDGEKYPSTVGTGSEDYIGYAWAANPPFITFDSALAAVSRIRPDAQEDTSVCRFHVCDDIPFSESFQGFIEVMPLPNCRPVLYDTCVYWYREDGARNPYPVVPPAERQHQRPSRQQRDAVPITILQPKSHPDAIEGENLEVTSIDSGRHWVQALGSAMHWTRAQAPSGPADQWSRGEHRIWTHGKQGDSIEFEFPVSENGTYELFAVFTKGADYGIFQISIDGKPTDKPIDLYDTKVTTSEQVSLGTMRFSEGPHTLKATAAGHNDNNAEGRFGRYVFGLDYLRLEKN